MKNLWILALAGLIISCSPTPEACFTPAEATIEFGAYHTLNNCSKHAGDISIDWNDGLLDEEFTLTHQYNVPGDYTIKITVFSPNGKKYDETELALTVNEPNTVWLTDDWVNYRVEAYTTSADDAVAQTLSDNGVTGTDLGAESLYTLDTDFDYAIGENTATITNANDESETVSWSQGTQARLYIDGYTYQVVQLTSTSMILRTNDATQFEKYDYNDEYDTENFDGYFLFYFSK